jgi:hypothetical protein
MAPWGAGLTEIDGDEIAGDLRLRLAAGRSIFVG